MYIYNITLQGNKARDRTTLEFNLGTPADHASAVSAADQIRGALVDITKAFVKKETLSQILSDDGTRPTDTSADTFEEAVVACYLNQPADAIKLHNLRVPAPIEALFLADGSSLDISNALLVQYVQQVSQHAFVSDNEQIVTTEQNGIDSGYARSRKKTFK